MFKPVSSHKNKEQLKPGQDYNPIQCEDLSPLAYWYETRITAPNTHWIESLPQFEVWKDQLEGTQVRIRIYQSNPDESITSITRCQAVFSSLQEWLKYRTFYFKSLEGEQP